MDRSLLAKMENKLKIMQAKNVEDAIQIASKMKAKNTYNWFRGQVAFKPPTSSFQRRVVDNNSSSAYEERLDLFVYWLHKTPLLSYLLKEENVDKLFSILQHYGFPTCYIDFTTEPSIAGFFASDCNTPPKSNGQSVIYCLNTDHLIRFYEQLQNAEEMKNFKVEMISLDISNLWRLEAQHGHFLYTNHDWTKLYEMDCIVFPWTGLPSFPNRNEVYPKHKSALEQLLDQYFFTEKSYQGAMNLRKMTDGNGKKLLHFVQAEELADGYDVDFFDKCLVELDSWKDGTIAWNMTVVENFHQTTGRMKKVKLRNEINAASLGEQIFVGLQSALSLDKQLRSYAVDWEFEGFSEEFPINGYSNLIKQAWNGMRILPFSDEDIANTFRELFNLCLIPNCDSIQGHLIDEAFDQWRADSFQIEIANSNQASSRAYCSERALLDLIDNEWKKSVKEKDEKICLTSALQNTNKPSLLFDFDGLVKLFSRDIIPTQLVRGRELILYNPAHLVVLGLP